MDDHFSALLLVDENLHGVEIIDRDNRPGIASSRMSHDDKLLHLCWSRYEIESYLVHPESLARFISQTAGANFLLADANELRKVMRQHMPGLVVDDPLGEHKHFLSTKARKDILPPILKEAGLINFDYTRYYEIAEVMKPEEIHPEVVDKLDAMAKHLGL